MRSKSTSKITEPTIYVHAALAGRPRTGALARLRGMPHGGAPRVLSLTAGISIVVSDVPAAVYNAEALDARLSDLDFMARCGAAHHAVANSLSDAYVVVPFRLFTLFSSEAKAAHRLRQSEHRIAEALARVRGRKEWVLRIGRPDPARRGSDRGPASAAPPPAGGADFLRAKSQARRDDRDRLTRVADETAVVFDALREIADEAEARPPQPGANLLLDAAFLVGTRRTSTFRRTLTRRAASLLQDGCPISLTGPWPPYSFSSLE